MDAEPGQESPRKLDPVRTNSRLLSSKGMASSPSPYDFCNHSRSDDDDDEDDEQSRGSMFCGTTYQQGSLKDAAGDISIEPLNSFSSHGVDEDSPQKNEVGALCFDHGSELSAGAYVEEPEEASADNSFFSSLYKDPLVSNDKYSPLDVENNALLWVAPLPADDDDQFDSIREDDDTDSNEWALSDSVSSLGSNKVRSKDTFAFEHRKAVVTGHFRVMVGQLLSREGIHADESGLDNWLEIVTSLSLQAAGIVKPDTSFDGGMDPGGYVKVKVVATGRPTESRLVRGIVCKKNMAHRRMVAKFKAPRLLLLGGSVELPAVPNHLSSLETLLQKESDHINWAISRIEAHRPNVLLVEKTVSRQAQELLLAKGISLVLNVKKSLLERISRCTGAIIAWNIENLASAKVGHCEQFYVEKYHGQHIDAAQGAKGSTKTLMFFEDCPKPFGCSILLKGGNFDELKKVKKAVKLAVFAAYHLALETSFLADEGVDLPGPCLRSPLIVALTDRESKSALPITNAPNHGSSKDGVSSPGHVVSQSGSTCLTTASAASSIPFSQDSTAGSPGLHEVIGTTLGKLSEAIALEDLGRNVMRMAASVIENFPGGTASEVLPAVEQSSEEVNKDSCTTVSAEKERQAIPLLEEGKNIDESMHGSLQISKGEKDAQDQSEEEFPPSPKDHLNILVSFSSSCLKKGTVCERGHLFRIRYYGTFDKPLGKFLRETLFDQTHKCPACGELKDAHVDCYTHRQGSLTISVHKQSESLAGESEGKIWMWHRCLKCPRVNGIPPATRRLVMSDAAWGLSFGKFLELSFSNHAAHSRVASCGHSLHRDCLRFYGFGNMVACIRYSPVHVFSVYLPPSKLDFHCFEHQTWLQQEIKEIAEKGEQVFKDVSLRLQNFLCKLFNVDGKSQDAKTHILELKDILLKQKDSFQRALNDAASCRGADQPHADILRLNFIRRSLSNCSNLWEKRLQGLTSSLKSPRSFRGFDSGLIGDSLLSFLRDISFGSGRNRSPLVSREPSSAGSPKPDGQAIGLVPSEKSKPLDAFSLGTNIEVGRGGLEPVSVLFSVPSLEEGTLASPMSTTKASDNVSSAAGVGEMLHPCNSISGGSTLQPGTVTSGSDLSGEGIGVHRSLSEGHFSCFRDVSATFDAAWTGKVLNPDELGNAESSSEHYKGNVESDPSLVEKSKSSSDTSDEGPLENCTLTSPAKSGVPSDIESWVGMPYLSFQVSHNDNSGSSLPKTGAEMEAQSANFSAVPTAEHCQAQEGVTASFFSDIDEPVVSVYDDEPTSVIAYAITSHEHQVHLFGKGEKQKDRDSDFKDRDPEKILPLLGVGIPHAFPRVDGRLEHGTTKQMNSLNSFESLSDDPLLDSRVSHLKVEFTDDTTQGRIKYAVTCYYAKQFDFLRKRCCKNDLDFIRSLCRCKKWGAQGGKSNVFFAKTADDRFVVKQVTRTELDSFVTFAPAYFKYMSDAVPIGSPTCLAKILGIYQVTVKHVKGGKELRMDLMIMENLLYGREVSRVYDLKGSLRSRYIADSTAKDAVLLDQNLLESMQTSPIFISNKAKKLLERAVWNDTAFLASVDVMDYSLLVGVDEGRQELVLGIIDFMRQYTWDKHLETWVKASGILGGPKNAAPTVISPMQYKKRFRKAMSTYFLMLPDQWSPVTDISRMPYIDDADDSLSAASGDPC